MLSPICDLVAVVEDRRAGQREHDRVQQLDVGPRVVEQRREPAADAEVELHARVLRVLHVHVVALLVRDHLEGQLVVVSEEQSPLRAVRNRRRAVEDLEDRRRVLAAQRHEHARHHREVERHVALVAVAEVLDDVLGPLVRLGEQDPVGIARVDLGAHAPQVLVRLGEVLAVRPVALVEIRHGVEAEAVDAEVEPEAQDVEHRLLHLGVVVVEVGLVREEAVPEVLAANGSHVQFDGSVSRKMIRASGQRSSVSDQTYQSARGLSLLERDSWNHGWSADVWFMTRSAMTRMPRWCACSTKVLKSSTFP